MSASSPYATFRADEWMRHSLIRPRKAFPPATAAAAAAAAGVSNARVRPPTSERRCDAVQGELFLFPVVMC